MVPPVQALQSQNDVLMVMHLIINRLGNKRLIFRYRNVREAGNVHKTRAKISSSAKQRYSSKCIGKGDTQATGEHNRNEERRAAQTQTQKLQARQTAKHAGAAQLESSLGSVLWVRCAHCTHMRCQTPHNIIDTCRLEEPTHTPAQRTNTKQRKRRRRRPTKRTEKRGPRLSFCSKQPVHTIKGTDRSATQPTKTRTKRISKTAQPTIGQSAASQRQCVQAKPADCGENTET